mgnify:FL=1
MTWVDKLWVIIETKNCKGMINNFSNILLNLGIIVLLSSCNFNAYNTIEKRNVMPENSLIQSYKGESTASSGSEFGVINRKIEFEYKKNKTDTTIEIVIRVTSGYNEGEILKQIEILTENNGLKMLIPDQILSREYVEEYRYSTTNPITRQKFINDPGGIDVVVQPDGTYKHVHRAASTKIVNETENQTNNHSGTKSQIFNELKIILNQEEKNIFKEMQSCSLFFQNSQIIIEPNKFQLSKLKNYL